MSTGLTYVTIVNNINYQVALSVVFNDYNEALSWSIWQANLVWEQIQEPSGLVITLYTTGPNQNGYVPCDGESYPAVLIPFD